MIDAQPEVWCSLDPHDWLEGQRYVARHPILDLKGHVHACELLFRAGNESSFHGDQQTACTTMLDNVAMFGLERLTGGVTAFVNCTQQALTEELASILPKERTVLEILETVEPTLATIKACRQLKAMGYRIALDDFVWAPRFEPLVALADYIKVDLLLTGPEERKALFARLRGSSIVMLAEKVETQEQYEEAKAEGFTLFQGYYFCRPVVVKNRKIPANRGQQFQLLQMLQADELDIHKASEFMQQDASLTYRLLRMVNSPVFAHAAVQSIEEALMVVGEKAFRHMVLVAIASELNGEQPMEILRMALLRARFCQLVAEHCGLRADEQFLLGMLSLLPAMMLVSMEDVLPVLPVRAEIQAALMGAEGRERALLGWLERYEEANWAGCDAVAEAFGLKEQVLLTQYQAAVAWAGAALQMGG